MRRPSPIDARLRLLHERHRDVRDGEVATYIPELASVDPEKFGIVIATVDGALYEVGDSDHKFTIQSVSKAFIFGLALQDHGSEELLNRVGVEPTGDPFNAIVLDEIRNRPPNPMVNAGAIAVTGLIEGLGVDERWSRIHDLLSRFAGRPLEVDETVEKSEALTGHRNRAIAHLMRGFDMLRVEVDEVLDLYFRQCSVLVDATDLALMGATLAARGRHPPTHQQVLSSEDTTAVLSVMTSCGMYDSSGEWIYRVGLPAKSGVGGGIVAVLPGQAGIAVFSPRLDARGNSVRGVRVCQDLSRDLGVHLFSEPEIAASSLRAIYGRDRAASRRSRDANHDTVLREHGTEILVVELQGRLNFGSVERLCRHVVGYLEIATDLIIDFALVTGADVAAAVLVGELVEECRRAELEVALSSVPRSGPLAEIAKNLAPEFGRFDTAEEALEQAEDRLLARHGVAPANGVVELGETELCRGFTGEQLDALHRVLIPSEFPAQATVTHPSDASSSAWIILEGSMTVELPTGESGVASRLRAVGPGSILGELALLSGEARSATIRTDTRVRCLELTPDGLEVFMSDCPSGAAVFLRNTANVIGRWLRNSNAHARGTLDLAPNP